MATYIKNITGQILLVFIAVLYCFIEAEGNGDFYIYISAAGKLSDGVNIYELQYASYYNYFYSVLFALLLKPFYTLPYFPVKLCWLLLNLFLYSKMFQLLAGSALVNKFEKKQKTIFLLLVFIFSLRFLRDNIHSSQVTILILWCCIYGTHLIRSGKPISGSAIIALGINIKLLPLVFLPYLLYRGYLRAFSYTLLFYGFSLLAPSLVIGHDYNMALLKSWWALINPTQQRHLLDVEERSFHGLSTLLATLLVEHVPDTYALTLKRNIADVSIETLSKILLITRLSLAALTAYFLKWPPFVKAKSILTSSIEVSYILLIIPLIFPHQQHYAFIFIVPAFSTLLYWLVRDFKNIPTTGRVLLVVCLSLIYLTANLKILLGEFNDYYEHYKILTYGSLLLIPLLVWASRYPRTFSSEVFHD